MAASVALKREQANDRTWVSSPGVFPAHLASICYSGSVGSYFSKFPPIRSEVETYLYSAKTDLASISMEQTGTSETDRQDNGTISVEMGGNWLIRWTATDSDLPFAFMRAYYRQLANFLPIYVEESPPLKTGQLIKAPGYLFVMATMLEVSDALIHRKLRSVTTVSLHSFDREKTV